MMIVRSIAANGADGYTAYLDATTIAPEEGGYYLGRKCEPPDSPGRWRHDFSIAAGPER